MPLILRLYLAVTRVMPGLLSRRVRQAHTQLGCAPDRWPERLGQATQPRPDGPLIWFHAASVGELVSVLDLANDMTKDTGATLLFTTMTQTSAELAARRLPPNAIHQFVPVDTPRAVSGFLDHWRPDMACFVESDLWPRLVMNTRGRDIPMALINARPSSSREKAPKTMGYLMSCFDRGTAQDTVTRDQLLSLNIPARNIATTGDLKSAAAALPHDPVELRALKDEIGDRPFWLAASTHPGEEEQVLDAHRQLLARTPDLLLILIPRHPERSVQIANLLSENDFSACLRSAAQPISPSTQVYLADTLGEMGLFFALAPMAFMGASFSDQGGHNPFEPAQLGTAVLHGPKVKNFENDYKILDQSGAAICVADAPELADTVARLIAAPEALRKMQDTGADLMAERAGIRQAVLDHLRPLLPARAARPRVAP